MATTRQVAENIFDKWWEAYRYDPASIDEAFEDAFKAGMLAAADVINDHPIMWRLHIWKILRDIHGHGG